MIRRKSAIMLFVGIIAVLVLLSLYHTSKSASHHTDTTNEPLANDTPKPSPQPQQDAALNQIISSWAARQSFSSTVVVEELTGSLRTASYHATDSIVPASTYKIYVAYAVLHAVEQRTYSLNTVTDDGNSIQTDLNEMILSSDNDTARTLGFLIGWKNINSLLQSQGISSTNLYNYVPPSTLPVGDKHTTATDLATILNKLYAGQLLNTTNTQLLLNLMKTQYYRERIPAGVPSSITVADKPGWLLPADDVDEYAQNDAAIVYGSKSTYVLVITTTGTGTQPLASLSASVYNHLEQ